MNVFLKFKKDFNELIETTYNTYWDLPLIPQKNYSTYLHKILKEVITDSNSDFYLNKEDLKQELCTLWLSYQEQFLVKHEKSQLSLRSYLIRRSLWDLRDWIKKNINIISVDPTFFIEEESEPDFKLDLKFLLTGTNYGPLKSLCGYERYIIFLKFKEDKSILEMSRILQKDRRVVKKHFDLIIEKIKESYSL